VNTASLQQDKKILLAQCELDRRQLAAAVAELEAKTGWAQLGATIAMYSIPKLRVAMPILGLILPHLLPGKSSGTGRSNSGLLASVGRGVQLAVKIGQKAALLGKGVRFISSRLRSSS
jgi:hypothetical protein